MSDIEILCKDNKFVGMKWIPESLNNGLVRDIIDDAKGGFQIMSAKEKYLSNSDDINPDDLKEYADAIKVHCLRLGEVKEWVINNEKEINGKRFVDAWFKVFHRVFNDILQKYQSMSESMSYHIIYKSYSVMGSDVDEIIDFFDINTSDIVEAINKKTIGQGIGQVSSMNPDGVAEADLYDIPEGIIKRMYMALTGYMDNKGHESDVLKGKNIMFDVDEKSFIHAVRNCQFEDIYPSHTKPMKVFLYAINLLADRRLSDEKVKKNYKDTFKSFYQGISNTNPDCGIYKDLFEKVFRNT